MKILNTLTTDFTKITFLLLCFIFLSAACNPLQQNYDNTQEASYIKNLSEVANLTICETTDCVLVNFGTYSSEGNTTRYAGDTFTYYLYLTPISKDINISLIVDIAGPDRTLGRTLFDDLCLKENTTTVIMPYLSHEKKSYSIYEFYTPGVYSLGLTSDHMVNFYRYYPIPNNYVNFQKIYFESEPKWQKDVVDLQKSWQLENQNLSNQQADVAARSYEVGFQSFLVTLAALLLGMIELSSKPELKNYLPSQKHLLILFITLLLFLALYSIFIALTRYIDILPICIPSIILLFVLLNNAMKKITPESDTNLITELIFEKESETTHNPKKHKKDNSYI